MVRSSLLQLCRLLTLTLSPVTLSGSILFILFGVIYLYEAFYTIDIDVSDLAYRP